MSKTHKQKFTRNKLQIKDKFDALDALLVFLEVPITFSLAIKLVALLLVMPGWLTLWIAIFADMGATLLVTLNSLRLLKIKE